MQSPTTLQTVEEFLTLCDTGRPRELVRGKVVESNYCTPWHGYVCSQISRFTDNFVEEHGLGRVICNNSAVITEREPDTVRGADVCYYSNQRLPRGEMPKGYLDVMPELVFEVRSSSDPWGKLLGKAAEYLDAGVLAVCLVDPEVQKVMVCEIDDEPRILSRDDWLSLPTVLPGFEVKVAQLFE